MLVMALASFRKGKVIAQVPTLETPQGGVFESNAIARYVARMADKGLFGHTSFEAVWSTPRLLTFAKLPPCAY